MRSKTPQGTYVFAVEIVIVVRWLTYTVYRAHSRATCDQRSPPEEKPARFALCFIGAVPCQVEACVATEAPLSSERLVGRPVGYPRGEVEYALSAEAEEVEAGCDFCVDDCDRGE